MADTRINHVVAETITLATAGKLTMATPLPAGAIGVEFYGTGASTPTWQFCPILRHFWWYDDSAGTYTNGTAELTDRTSTLALNSLEATNDFLYIGCDEQFRGVFINITNTNTTASTDLAATYWDGSAWTGLTETDNTASGGISFAQDGNVVWTMPTDWAKTSVNGVQNLYCVRFNFDAAFDATVSIADLTPLSVQTNRPSSPASTPPLPRYFFDRGSVGGIEATGDNADTLVITWFCATVFSTSVAE